MPVAQPISSRKITISKCNPVWLSETNQGFHVYGEVRHHGMLPVPFAFATDECGAPLLRKWYPDGLSEDDRTAILDAVDAAM